MKGSFGILYDKLVEKIKEGGGKIYYSSAVDRIQPQEDKTLNVYSNGKSCNFDRVIVTTAPGIFKQNGCSPYQRVQGEAFKNKVQGQYLHDFRTGWEII